MLKKGGKQLGPPWPKLLPVVILETIRQAVLIFMVVHRLHGVTLDLLGQLNERSFFGTHPIEQQWARIQETARVRSVSSKGSEVNNRARFFNKDSITLGSPSHAWERLLANESASSQIGKSPHG